MPLGAAGDKSPALTVSSHHGHRREDFFFKYDRHSGANVAMGDGAVYYLPPGGLSIENLRNILQVGGCRWDDPRFEADLQYDEHRRLNWPNIAALAVWLLSVGTLLTCAVRSRKKLVTELGSPSTIDEILMPSGLLALNGRQFSNFTFTLLDGPNPSSRSSRAA